MRQAISSWNCTNAEDLQAGRLFGVAYAEMFKAHSRLLIDYLTVFRPGLYG